MYLSYIGNKEELSVTRPELKEEYHFKGKDAVEVEASDGKYLKKEFGRSFKEVDAPPLEKPKAPVKKPKAPTKPKATATLPAAPKAPAKENDTLSDMGADGPAPE